MPTVPSSGKPFTVPPIYQAVPDGLLHLMVSPCGWVSIFQALIVASVVQLIVPVNWHLFTIPKL